MFFGVNALMTSEIECPVCDKKVPMSSLRCPNCGADLAMATFEDLEALAQDIAAGRPSPVVHKQEAPRPAPAEKAKAPSPAPAKKDEPAAAPRPAFSEMPEEKPEGDSKKGFGRLFGRKKK